MLKVFGLCLCFASFNTVRCEIILPQVYIPELKLYPQNPPKLPVLCLSEEKFSLPQFCQNASEWDDVDMSIKILTDYSEADPERSTFASFINLIKFILIKEELTCLDAMSGPIITVKRPEGKIFKDNSEILNNIELALANKPKQKMLPVNFRDYIDVDSMIPMWRPRGNYRRQPGNTVPIVKVTKSNSTCACPESLQNLSPLTIIGGNLNPMTKGIPSKSCPCSKCEQFALQPNCKLQSLPSTNIRPVLLGCGGNCNVCQRMASPLMAGCPKLTTPVLAGNPKLATQMAAQILAGCPKMTAPVLASYQKQASPMLGGCPKLASVGPSAFLGCGCPKTNVILGGCRCSNPMLSCPKCGLAGCNCQAKQVMSLVKSEAIPVLDCFGNLMKQVQTTYLVPFMS